MLKKIRQTITKSLWDIYRADSVQLQAIEKGLQQKAIHNLILDHFAIIDLPSERSGIPPLQQLFSAIGYTTRGSDYLPDKQNDFLWMTESNSMESDATQVLPQIVVADFRLDELPIEVRKIITKYTREIKDPPLTEITCLSKQAAANDENASKRLNQLIIKYLAGREWSMPTMREFYSVQEFNELLAWVLLFGRKPNHFTLSIHLLNQFADLPNFLEFVSQDLNLPLNKEGGLIKGDASTGIAQAATAGEMQQIKLADGIIEIAHHFVEFVWRFPNCEKPILWKDFFTGFVAQHADSVIESLYVSQQ